MLSSEQNELLTRVGRDTPMGNLLRRYWWPIAAVAELDEKPTKPVRLLGEDLVLYRDKRGVYGLLDRYCPHRRVSLAYGMADSDGLRCSYHGWKFNEKGDCTDQPFECALRPQGRFMSNVKIKAYSVGIKAGLIWAYLGPEPAPCLWDWEAYGQRGYKQLMFTELPCNWLQCQENSIDPVHFEWLHENWSRYQRGELQRAPTHLKIAFDEFEHGFVYRRVLTGATESDDMWTVGRVCLWPNALYAGGFDWNVPIDDENTLRVRWSIHRLPGERPFEQDRIPYWYSPLTDPETGGWYTTYGTNQDYAAMVSQGRVADRTKELLGQSDRGIILMRKRFLHDLDVVASGGDPKGVLRDAAANVRLPLPCMSDQRRVPDGVRPEPLAGQPAAILEELTRIWNDYAEAPRGERRARP